MSDNPALSNSEDIEGAAQLSVYDQNGGKVQFGSIFANQKTVVVFIRHFACSTCQGFVEQLATVPSASLEAAGTKIVLIGCGEWQGIAAYVGFKGPIYANPTGELYQKLGMRCEPVQRTPAGQAKRRYATQSLFAALAASLFSFLFHPSLIGNAGKFTQLGGDFILGPGNKCSFSSRMKHIEDHVDVADLMREAGVNLPS